MVLLLVLSTAITILAPDPREQNTERREPATREEGSTGKSEPQAAGPSEAGTVVGNRPDPVARASVMNGGKPESVVARPGQRLILEVPSPRTEVVAVPELGRTATADRWAPAVFDLLMPDSPAVLEVVSLPGEDPIARILVR